MNTCKTCGLNAHSAAAEKMVAFIWPSLKHCHEYNDRRETCWGTKTECGLMACFDRIMAEHDKAPALLEVAKVARKYAGHECAGNKTPVTAAELYGLASDAIAAAE